MMPRNKMCPRWIRLQNVSPMRRSQVTIWTTRLRAHLCFPQSESWGYSTELAHNTYPSHGTPEHPRSRKHVISGNPLTSQNREDVRNNVARHPSCPARLAPCCGLLSPRCGLWVALSQIDAVKKVPPAHPNEDRRQRREGVGVSMTSMKVFFKRNFSGRLSSGDAKLAEATATLPWERGVSSAGNPEEVDEGVAQERRSVRRVPISDKSWLCTDAVLVQHWCYTLVPRWSLTGTAPLPHWYCVGAIWKLRWTLTLHWHCPGTTPFLYEY